MIHKHALVNAGAEVAEKCPPADSLIGDLQKLRDYLALADRPSELAVATEDVRFHIDWIKGNESQCSKCGGDGEIDRVECDMCAGGGIVYGDPPIESDAGQSLYLVEHCADPVAIAGVYNRLLDGLTVRCHHGSDGIPDILGFDSDSVCRAIIMPTMQTSFRVRETGLFEPFQQMPKGTP